MFVFRVGYIIFRTQYKMKMWAPRVQKLRILKWKQQNIKPSVRPLWVWGPMWLHKSYTHETGLTHLLLFPLKGQKRKNLEQYDQVSLHVNKPYTFNESPHGGFSVGINPDIHHCANSPFRRLNWTIPQKEEVSTDSLGFK